jgi:hypothetical protein
MSKRKLPPSTGSRAHGESAAVRQFESVYRPYLAGGPVVFTDYTEVATNQRG